MKILLVDDRIENIQALVAILEGPGCSITTAASGPEALRIMLREDFAVVLLDVQMPEMDGFEVLRLMRARQQTASTPVIFVTGRGQTPAHVFAGYEAGAVDYLLKPLDPHIVRCKVEVFLELDRRRRALEEKTAELARLNTELEARVAARTRDLEQANLQLETFVYSASHSLRTPLRTIEGLIAVVLEDCASIILPEDHAMLRRVATSAYHMSELLSGLLRLAGLRHLDVARAWIDLAEIARSVANSRQRVSTGREIAVRLPETLPVFADESLVRLVLDILFDNAWKFTQTRPRGEVELGVTETPGGETCYWVRDNGIGFDPSFAASLFHVFQRLHGPGAFGGPGLGLATVRRAVTLLGGRTWAEGRIEGGATFFFTLPAPEEETRAPETEATEAQAG